MQVIEIQDVHRVYTLGDVEVHALRGVGFSVAHGELLTVMGPSGSGKSTLMNILGCLDQADQGTYRLDGELVSQLDDDQLAAIRNKKIGFVFQTFNLLARTSAVANVELPLIYGGLSPSERRRKAIDSLEAVGLGDRIHHNPNELSGGQQQRVAVARALVNDPSIILADEPTGNLDSTSGTDIMRILQSLNREKGITVLLVTHDPFIARHTERVIQVQDGLIVSDDRVHDPLVAGETVRPSDMSIDEQTTTATRHEAVG